ncbi:GDSL-type esterase/lipase family protein [Luteipulveratus sp. YIM 133132]|uniref:SGNH/GDSL hydrolase family protein n=1 Tax=Luteipulveratus flavus TaxID=3031728 RepID=UPI0023AF3090|nr:GDSL-type esterase/lipase family protein [Luteipulveratus sp. YIM 133132]MDE9366324.1 GDSL-type esterase/lipase family protein [Luteipulveratus sp. YIM 133132]
MQRRRATVILSATALAATSVIGVVASGSTTASAAGSDGWYVAMGDSLAAGYQPGQGDDKTGGYVGGVLAGAKKSGSDLQLKNFACSGEDTTTMTSGAICGSYDEGTNQLAAAESFLKTHPTTRLITLDIGANDVQRCAKGSNVDLPCITAGLQKVATNLPPILTRIRAAAPDARIVVANYYNPFLAAWLLGPDGQSLAKVSVNLQRSLNSAIDGAAKGVNARVADVGAAFKSEDFTSSTTPSPVDPTAKLPTNVALICAWTWMCAKNDIHANDTGYGVIAQTVLSVVGTLPTPTPTPTGEPSSPTPSSPTPTGGPGSPTTTGGPTPTGTATGPIVQTG